MKYFNVTVMEKGKKRQELVKAVNKMAAINLAKQKFPMTMVMKAMETSAPLEDSLSELFSGLPNSFLDFKNHLNPRYRLMIKYQRYDK